MRKSLHLAGLVLMSLSACAPDVADDVEAPTRHLERGQSGKEDSPLSQGPLTSLDRGDTAAWEVRNNWEDTDSAEARQAGLAWPANSGLTWDEKYAAWIKSLNKVTTSTSWSGESFEMTTPWGKTLPAPSLECAEVSMFMRMTFAAWYGLPFYMEAWEGGQRIFIGHFGVVTKSGRWADSPRFKTLYADHTSRWRPGDAWPTDAKLASRGLDAALTKEECTGEGDTRTCTKVISKDDTGHILYGDFQKALGEYVRFGGYLDQLHLNKRAGHVTLWLLNMMNSENLADPNNAYNVKPEAVREGDTLLERWQKKGIGHTLVVKNVGQLATGELFAELMAGSMPRIQPYMKDEVASKEQYFTNEKTGGVGNSYDDPPVPYSRLGGGLKRWRVARAQGSQYVNTFMRSDIGNWIDATNHAAIEGRPERFKTLLGEVPAAEKRVKLEKAIAESRLRLRQKPASCSARIERAQAMDKLLELAAKLGVDRSDLEKQTRTLEDYVFGRLEYERSKTCCFNNSTAEMAQIILDYAQAEQRQALDNRMCAEPTIFRWEPTGYDRWAQYAAQTGRGAQWKAWEENEECPQRTVTEDTASYSWSSSYCDLFHPELKPPAPQSPSEEPNN